MDGQWRGWSPGKPPLDTRLPVALYQATIRLDVERSELSIATELDRAVLEAALSRRPAYCPVVWPELLTLTDADLRRLALLKIGVFFDFATRLPGNTSREIRHALFQRFPQLTVPETGKRPGRYQLLRVYATIWSDGACDGGYQQASPGLPPLGRVPGESLDIFVKNVARADIRDHYKADGGIWPESVDPLASPNVVRGGG
jgi:hypothetical protein